MDESLNFPSSSKDSSHSEFFSSRKVTGVEGRKFENLVIAYLILVLMKKEKTFPPTAENEDSFSLTAENEDYRGFDDIVFEAQLNAENERKYYAMQLKYRETTDDRTRGWEDISKYFNHYQTLHSERSNEAEMILFTNKPYPIHKGIQIKKRKFIFEEIQKEKNSALKNLFDKFEEEGKGTLYNVQSPEYKHLFFYINTTTNNDKLDETIEKFFRTEYNCQKEDQKREYINFIERWKADKGKKKRKLKQDFMQKVIALCLFLGEFEPLSFKSIETCEKRQILKKAFVHLGTTYLSKRGYEAVKDFWADDAPGIDEIKNLKKYQIGTRFITADDETTIDSDKKMINIWLEALNDDDNIREKSLSLWLTDKCPLVLHDKEFTRKGKEMWKNKIYIFLQEENVENDASAAILTDTKNGENNRFLREKFECTLQGKNIICLEKLVGQNKEIPKIITMNVLAKLLKTENLRIGNEEQKLPDPFITPSVSRIILRFEILETIKDIFVISKATKTGVTDRCKKLEETEIKPLDEIKPEQQCRVIVTEDICDTDRFKSVVEKFPANVCHYLRMTDEKKLEWIKSEQKDNDGSYVDRLREFEESGDFVKCKENYEKEKHKINIFCANSGMGRTTLLKYLMNSSTLTTYWAILINLKEKKHYKYFSPQKEITVEGFKKHILEDYEQCKNLEQFDKKLLEILLEEGRIMYYWDGLDSLRDDVLEVVKKIIKDLNKKNEKTEQWIVCGDDLKENLENYFNVLAKTVKRFDETEQKEFFKKSEIIYEDGSKFKYEDFENKRTLRNDILEAPYMLKTLVNYMKEKNEKITNLSLHRLFEYLVDEKFKMKENLKFSKEACIDYYQTKALEKYFQNILELLNVCTNSEVKGDPLGFFKRQPGTDFSKDYFAEYFVASYLSNNKENIEKIPDFLFEEKYKNIRLFLDLMVSDEFEAHRAFLDKDYERLKRYGEKLFKEDKHGRTVLELACRWSQKYPIRTIDPQNQGSSWPEEKPSDEDWDIMEFLINEFEKKRPLEEIVLLLNSDKLMHNDKFICLLPLLVFKRNHPEKDLKVLDKYSDSVFRYCILFDYVDNLDVCGKLSSLQDVSLISEAIRRNCLKIIKKIIKIDNFKYLIKKECCQGLIDAYDNECREMVELLLETKIELSNKSHKEFLLRVCKKEEDVNFLKSVIERIEPKNTELSEFENELNTIDAAKIFLQNLIEKTFENKTFLIRESCTKGFIETVKILVDGNEQLINSTDEFGKTALHYVCENGHKNILTLLLEKGADAEVEDKFEKRPIHYACESKNDNLEIVETLLAKNVQLDEKNQQGKMPIHLACENNHYNVVNRLIQHENTCISLKDGENRLPIHCAYKSEKIMKLLIEKGSKLNAPDNDGKMPIHYACAEGYVDIVKTLIGKEVKLNEPDSRGQTPIHEACDNSHHEIVKLLIEADIKIVSNDKSNKTLLRKYCEKGDREMVEYLLQKDGQLIDLPDKHGKTALHYACEQGHTELVKLLLPKTNKLNVVDRTGKTPLCFACRIGHEEIVNLLLRDSKCVNTETDIIHWAIDTKFYKNQSNFRKTFSIDETENKKMAQSYCHLLKTIRRFNIVNLLLEKKADVNAVGKDKQSLIHKVLRYDRRTIFSSGKYMSQYLKNQHVLLIKLLIDPKSNIHAEDEMDQSPMHYAARFGCFEVVKLLIDNRAKLDAKDKSGKTPRDYGEKRSSKIKKLLESVAVTSMNETVHRSNEENQMDTDDVNA